MSAPRYMLALCLVGTNMKYHMKLRTRLGDHEGLQRVIEALTKSDIWQRFSEGFVEKSGGLANMEREWNRNYAKLVGHDHHNVTAEGYWELVDKESKE